MEKSCRVCKKHKLVSEFYFRKDSKKFRNECKKCLAEIKSKNYQSKKLYYQEKHKKYKENNKEYLKENHRKYMKKRRANPTIKLRNNINRLISLALKSQSGSKSGYSIIKFLPYSLKELKNHLESQFEPWMTWDNWGRYNAKTWDDGSPDTWVWHIDHITPQCQFPYDSMNHPNFKKCWALDNLQPLSAKENLAKSKYTA